MRELHQSAAYGGAGWSPRTAALSQEIGQIWGSCGLSDEWSPLEAVLLHQPGPELESIADPNDLQLLARPDAGLARAQHGAIAAAYLEAGVRVSYIDPPAQAPLNLMFVADLFWMTPEGAILGRPASTVRAGEERLVARRLAAAGIPILRSVRGNGTFEGADAAWIDPHNALLATGLRTNQEGAAQVRSLLVEMGVEVINVGLPHGAMHLMGVLRFADRDLAIAWPGKVPYAAVSALREAGFEVLFLPDHDEAVAGQALNFVTLGPSRILMAAGNPITQKFYEAAGLHCQTVEVNELLKAAGGIACLTGVIQRKRILLP